MKKLLFLIVLIISIIVLKIYIFDKKVINNTKIIIKRPTTVNGVKWPKVIINSNETECILEKNELVCNTSTEKGVSIVSIIYKSNNTYTISELTEKGFVILKTVKYDYFIDEKDFNATEYKIDVK